MRPLELTLKGIRSYRREQTIDLRNIDLMAIVGETGAGKSSILEAMYFALFGTCTWDRTNSRVLIAHGGDGTLRVQFTFRARGRTWTVTRAVSVKTSPAPLHRLECLDDGTVTTGADAVTKAVRHHIGLDEKTFLRSVILPQGRFQELLQTSASERAGILKRILGIDQLDGIRDDASKRLLIVMPNLETIRAQRSALPDDPAAAAELATANLQEAEGVLATLRYARQQLNEETAAQNNLISQRTAITEALEEMQNAKISDAIAHYDALLEIEGQLNDRQKQLESQKATAENDAGIQIALQKGLGSTAAGTGPAAIAVTILAVLDAQVRQINELELYVAEETQRLTTEGQRVDELDQAANTAEALAIEAKAAEEVARQASNTADQFATRIAIQLAELRQAHALHTQRLMQIEEKESELAGDEHALTAAESLELQSRRESEAAQAEYDILLSKSAAAQAALHSHPGAACPVCDRELPQDFVPPQNLDIEPAGKKAAAAKRRHTKHAEKLSTLNGKVIVLRRALDQTRLQQQSNAHDLVLSQRALAAHTGPFDMADPDLHILRNIRAAKAEAQQQLSAKSAHHLLLSKAAATAATTASEAKRQLAKDQAAQRKSSAKLEKLHTESATQLALLADIYRPSHVTVSAITERADLARHDQAEETKAWQHIGQLHKTAADAASDLRKLDEQRTRQIDSPARELAEKGRQLHTGTSALAAFIDGSHPPAKPSSNTLGDQRTWSAAIIDCANVMTAAANDRLNQLLLQIRECKKRINLIVETAACGDQSLEQAFERAVGCVAVAQRELGEASTQTTQASHLDSLIAATAPHVRSLQALASLLTDAKFIGFVVGNRQTALLGTATALLRDMTRRRFAFADDFQIFDSTTGQLREAKTLSGGETFQASLALALAVVEQLGTVGGRAEALFLDEGFASLDAASLGDALDALNHQVQAGRLVAVISHLKAVAQHVPHVLVATKTQGGSHIAWADEHEKADLADADFYGGLHG